MLEIVYSILLSLSNYVSVVSILLICIILSLMVCWAVEDDLGDLLDNKEVINKKIKAYKRSIKNMIIALVVISPFTLIPSPNKLFEIRISLIKFNLASPSNVEKGIDHITELGKKLECKYLDICETKEK